MKKLAFITAAALVLSSPVAFAQTYDQGAPSVIGGGAVGSVSSVTGAAVGTAGDIVGGTLGVVGTVGNGVGGILTGRSAYDGTAYGNYASPCTVTGGGAVGTCSSVR